MTAFALAVVCFLLAFSVNESAYRQEESAGKLAGSVNNLQVSLAGVTGNYDRLSMAKPEKADRSMVGVWTLAGVMFTGFGLVCLAVKNQPR